jgi:ketosteroid isomerase-like protein
MPKTVYAAIALLLLGTRLAQAADTTADTKVIDHHVANMKTGNLEAVLSDYAPDAVVVTPPGLANASGVFVGAENRKLFSLLTDKDHVPGNKTMQTRYEGVGPDTTIMHWVQYKGTPKQVAGHDVFVIRSNKVVFQSVSVDAAK